MARERGSHKQKIIHQEWKDHIHSLCTPRDSQTALCATKYFHRSPSLLNSLWRLGIEPVSRSCVKSCTGIAGGDLISAPPFFPRSFLLDLRYLQVWEIFKCINNMVISRWYESSEIRRCTGVRPVGFQNTAHFINCLQTQASSSISGGRQRLISEHLSSNRKHLPR